MRTLESGTEFVCDACMVDAGATRLFVVDVGLEMCDTTLQRLPCQNDSGCFCEDLLGVGASIEELM
jgi:hypothetical protein